MSCSIVRLLDCSLALGSVLTAQPIAHGDALEPSVVNEVEHALSRAPTNAPCSTALPFPTNGLSRTQLAIRLVSAQRSDGRWLSGTNDVTSSVIQILNSL